MQHVRGGFPSKLSDGSLRSFAGPRRRALFAGVVAPAAWLLAGCGGGGDLISTVALPSQQTTDYADGLGMPMAAEAGRLSGTPELTPAQKDYLSALAAAGIHPSSELRALSIGAYVCQARAAGQSDQTVWDSVAPMVRSDVISTPTAAPQSAGPQPPAVTVATVASAPSPGDDSVVSNVIRIATGRLC